HSLSGNRVCSVAGPVVPNAPERIPRQQSDCFPNLHPRSSDIGKGNEEKRALHLPTSCQPKAPGSQSRGKTFSVSRSFPQEGSAPRLRFPCRRSAVPPCACLPEGLCLKGTDRTNAFLQMRLPCLHERR